MTEINPDWLPAVIDIAYQAGDRILQIYDDEQFIIEHKDDRTPLTQADLAAHKSIVAGLSSLAPDVPVLSEESAGVPYDTRRQWHRYWLVDPLDGTKEFIKRNGEFTVNIALIDGDEPVLGVIVVPVTGLCYYASRGHGAWKKSAGGTAERIRVRAVDQDNIMIVGSRSHGSERMQQFRENLGEHDLMSMGSSLKFCLVAEGQADIYPRLGLTSEWDTAAAQCIVEEAGGQVIDVNTNDRLRYNCKDSLLNPEFLVIADASHDWQRYLPA